MAATNGEALTAEPFAPQLEAFIAQAVREGHFAGRKEVLQTALWMLKEKYETYKTKHEELRQLIAVGTEQSKRGQVAPLDMDAIKAEVAERLRQEQNQEAQECRK